MAKIKMRWEAKIRCYKDIPDKNRPQNAAFAEVLGMLLSDAGGTSVTHVNDPAASVGNIWKDQPNFKVPDPDDDTKLVDGIDPLISFLQLSKTGQGKILSNKDGAKEAGKQIHAGVGLFYLNANEFKQNCTFESSVGADSNDADKPNGNLGYNTSYMVPVSPNKAHRWETYNGGVNSDHTRVGLAESILNAGIECRSKESFPKNQQYRVYLQFLGAFLNGKAGQAVRVMWGGNTYSVVWRNGQIPAVERWDNGWQPWFQLEGAPASDFKKSQTVMLDIRRVGGRMVLSLYNDGDYAGQWDSVMWDTDTAKAAKHKQLVWPKGSISYRAFNVGVTFGFSKLLHLDVNRKPLEAHIRRNAPTTQYIPAAPTTIAHVKGWWSSASQVKVDAITILQGNASRSPSILYNIRLRASKDGIDSPCINGLAFSSSKQHTPTEPDYIDILPAAKTGSFSSAEPGIMSGSTFSLNLSRNQLEMMAKEQSIDWQDYVKKRAPVDFMIRWQYEDYTYSPWVGRFRGYIGEITKAVKQANEWTMGIRCYDPVYRLQAKNSLIDDRYAPLDLFWANGRLAPYYVSDAVKYIISVEMGEQEAVKINGNGDPQRFVSPEHPPLMSIGNDYAGWAVLNNLITDNKFNFMPPFGQASIDWIKSLIKRDYTVFYYGYADGSGVGTEGVGGEGDDVAWPIPITGRYPLIVANRPQHIIPDAVYSVGDANMVMQSADTRENATNAYNVVQSWSKGDLNGLPLPALFVGKSRIATGYYNAQEESWPVTLLLQDDFYAKLPNVAQQTVNWQADLAMAEFEGKKMQTPTVSFRGEPTVAWGDTIVCKMQKDGSDSNFSDPSIDIDGITGREPVAEGQGTGNLRTFRIMSLDESYNFEHRGAATSYTTTTKVRPLSREGA